MPGTLLYSATKQENKTSQITLKIAQICLLVTRMDTTTIFIVFYKTLFSSYNNTVHVAKGEAIHTV